MNKKPMIIVGLIFGLIIIALTVYLILSLTTDLFKPTSEIFQKYFTNGIERIDKLLDFSKEQEYINTLNKSNYKENTKINLKYTNSKNENEIFNISLNGITNNTEKNSYKTIEINYGENEFMNLEYLRENQADGLLFKDIVKQFISIDIENLDDVLKYIGINIQTDEKNNVKVIWDTVTEKKEDIKNIILKRIKELNEKKYVKQKSMKAILNNGEEKVADVYSLKMTEEDVKELCLEILKKLDNQEEINRINSNSIQFPEIKINIYTENGNLLRAETEIEKNQINLDFYENEINAKYKEVLEENSYTVSINIKQEEQNKKIDFEDSNRNNIKLTYSINKDANNQNSNIEVSIKNDYIKGIDLNLEQALEISENVIEGIDKKFENISNFNLSKMKENERSFALNELLKKIDILVSNKNSQFNSEVLNLISQLNKGLQEQFQEIREKQKRDFNNQFLPYEGQKVEKEVIYNLLELVGRNIGKYVTTGEDKYRIFISEGNNDVKLVEELKEKINKSDKDFSVKFEYNSEGKINVIRIQGYEKNN